MFSRSNLNVLGGSFTQVTELHSGPAAFERLQQATSSAAFHNSNERFDPPRCHPRTRVAVLERIMNWILGKEDLNALILWLYGPAGSGKSAIAQSIAELCYAANILLATFFFSRSDHTRNRGDALIPTLAYQVASSIPEARARIEKIIDRDPLIFKRSLEAQIKSLLVDPVQDLVASGYFNDPSSSPRLIIIDGLDECQDFRVQSQIIESIAHALQQHHLPFIFLIASRPEQQISYSFNCGRFPELRTSLVLDNSFHPDDDIRLFLQDSFLRIKNTHPKMRYIPADWPLSKVIESLVRKASSQFIYAATVMRYTSSIRHIPTNRLDVILGLRPAHNDTPFAELDVLYMHIMSSLDEVESALLIIGAVLLRYEHGVFRPRGLHEIAKFLALHPEDVEVILGDLASVIEIEHDRLNVERRDPQIRVLHASLEDFLFDMARSRQFYINPRLMHTKFANQCLQDLKAQDEPTFRYAYKALLFHLNDALPTPDLRRGILDLSFDDVLQRLVNASFAKGFVFQISNSLSQWIILILKFIKMLGFEDSDHIYAHQLASYDRLIMMELDKYGLKAATKFLLSIVCIVRSTAKLSDLSSPWISAQIGIHDDSQLNLYTIALYDPESLIAFLEDSTRSGIYAMGDDKYAVAALWCLVILGLPNQQLPARYTNHDLKIRRNSPWRWRKFATTSGFFKKRRQVARKTWKSWDDIHGDPLAPIYRQLKKERRHSPEVYPFILKYLPEILDRSGKLDTLVKLARRRSFADRSLKYPRRTKRAKEAMERYVARVAGEGSVEGEAA